MNKDSLYFIQSDVTGMIKIGRSKNPLKRLKQLQTGNANKLKLIAFFEGLGWREKLLHESLKDWSKEGEWFDPKCVGSIPIDLYEKIEYGSFDDWWIYNKKGF
jgi:hypothetical protein